MATVAFVALNSLAIILKKEFIKLLFFYDVIDNAEVLIKITRYLSTSVLNMSLLTR